MDLFMAEERRLGPRVSMRWWEQEGLDVEGMRTEYWESEQTEGGGGDGRDGNEDRQISSYDYTMANVILGTDPNAPLAYDPELEPHHPIVSMLGGHVGWLERLWCLSKRQFPPPGGFLMTTMSKGWRDCKYILDITNNQNA